MAFLAGATDAYGLTILRDLYVSFMSGNTTMLGVSAGSGDGVRSAQIAELIGLFVAGAATGAMASDMTGRFRTPCVILIASMVLCLPTYEPAWAVYSFVFAMGALNLALGKVGAEGVGLTYVTGALVKFGQGLGHWVTGNREDLSWLIQAAMWASILLGAFLARLAMRFGAGGLWQLPLLGFLLAGIAFAIGRSERASVIPAEARDRAAPG